MKLSILCSSKSHPVYPHLQKWLEKHRTMHDVELMQKASELHGGDILFLISCSEIVKKTARSKYKKCLVIHASDVPKGRGWSPHIWQIIEEENVIPVTLLEAEDGVDTGNIWMQKKIELDGHELFDEINEKLFAVELLLMDYAVEHFETVRPVMQPDIKPTYYRKRSPEDSRLNPQKTIAEQFDLLRVADPNRFPAFFDLRGYRYRIVLQKEGKSRS